MSSRSLEVLRPEFRKLVDLWLADCHSINLDVLVYCTVRSNEEQDALYAQGRTVPGKIVTNAHAGQSAHNYGLAIDFVPLENGKPRWDGGNPLYLHAIAIAEARGLESLCKSAFPEWAHLQMKNWHSMIGAVK